MGWQIDCGNPDCQQKSWPRNIVEVITDHCDSDGMLICLHCNKPSGYVQKIFHLQEEGETWEPILRGIIKLGDEGDTYQPFVYLASYAQNDDQEKPASILALPITDLWFSYYKDLRGHIREDGRPGRLKMGYGPGGPPVLGIPHLLELMRHLLRLNVAKRGEVESLLYETPLKRSAS